jgi:hypothetical protein
MDALDQMREQISAFDFKRLTEAQRTVARAVAELPRRASELGRNVEIAEAKAAQRENALMMEHGGNIPLDDGELVRLRADVAMAHAELRELNVNQTKLRELSRCLKEELSVRSMDLDSQIRTQCELTWAEMKDEMCADAVESLTAAIMACAPTYPESVDPALFVTNQIGEQLRASIKREADKLRKRIREEIVKNNPKLG